MLSRQDFTSNHHGGENLAEQVRLYIESMKGYAHADESTTDIPVP
jgi:hypothetical protein